MPEPTAPSEPTDGPRPPMVAAGLGVIGALALIGGGVLHFVSLGFESPLTDTAAGAGVGVALVALIMLALPVAYKIRQSLLMLVGAGHGGFAVFTWSTQTGFGEAMAVGSIAAAGAFLVVLSGVFGLTFASE